MKDIAIIGMAVDLPNTKSLEAFWKLISEANTLVGEFPEKRQEQAIKHMRYRRSRSAHSFKQERESFHNGCFLNDAEMFDYRFFNITPKQAQTMDPHQRLLLKTFYRAIDDAGYANKHFRDAETGVFVGFASNPGNDYTTYINDVDPTLGQVALTGNVPCMLANRISHFLDLHGPSTIVDSACSASLVATLNAVKAIQAGDCRMAMVGGARLCTPIADQSSKIGIESSDGKTRTFDARADGTGLGEGSGAVVLKSLDDAIADGDYIYAVLKGGAINHDGFTESLTTPDAGAQSKLLEKAWANAGIKPTDISYIEAHGTATKVGDPIEINGLKKATSAYDFHQHQVALGTVKTNIGHLFEASGILSVIKVALMLQHKSLVKTANFVTENPLLNLDSSPFFISKETRDWTPVNSKYLAGISAFGLGGTNCHVLIEAAPQTSSETEHYTGPHLFTCSAPSLQSFERLKQDWIDYLSTRLADDNLAAICQTQLLRRQHHAFRTAKVVSSMEELMAFVSHMSPTQRPNQPEAHDVFELSNSMNVSTIQEHYLAGGLFSYEKAKQHERHLYVKTPSPSFDEVDCLLRFPDDISLLPPNFERDGLVTFCTRYHEKPLPGVNLPDSSLKYLILDIEGSAKAQELSTILSATGCDVTRVEVGNTCDITGDNKSVRLVETDFSDLATFVKQEGISQIIHVTHSGESADNTEALNADVNRKLNSLFWLAKALITQSHKCRLTVLTENARYIEHKMAKDTINEVNASLIGLGIVIPRETPFISVKSIDIEPSTPARTILFELGANTTQRMAVYRGDIRYTEVFEYNDVISSKYSDCDIREGGTYLITGGTGDLGLAVAQMLAEKSCVNIVLTSRRGLPAEADWSDIHDEEILSKIAKIRSVQALGSKVLVKAVDASDRDSVRQLCQEMIGSFGKIDGIFHAAGIPGTGLISNRSQKQFDDVIQPKIQGTYFLSELIEEVSLDFLVLFSSVAAVFPTAGQSDYSAANSYMDAFAAKHNGKVRIVSMQWCAWKEIGMAVAYNTQHDLTFKSIPTEQGLDCLYNAIRHTPNHIFVGEVNYTDKIVDILKNLGIDLSADILEKIDHRTTMRTNLTALTAETEDRPTHSQSNCQCTLTGRSDGDYTAMEIVVANSWAESLGYEEIDLDDEFLQLGGESITALSIVSAINNESSVKIDVALLLELSSVRNIAAYLTEELEVA